MKFPMRPSSRFPEENSYLVFVRVLWSQLHSAVIFYFLGYFHSLKAVRGLEVYFIFMAVKY